jgi:hypothetical protein
MIYFVLENCHFSQMAELCHEWDKTSTAFHYFAKPPRLHALGLAIPGPLAVQEMAARRASL